MPGLVKIGRTSQADTATRLSQLYTTGVPVPFELKFACRVQNPDEVELAMHTAFGHSESIQGGNFFELIPSRRLQSLGCFTPRMLLQKWLLKRWGSTKSHWPPPKFFAHVVPNLDFSEMGIPVGATLECPAKRVCVTVVGPRKVLLSGTEMSLTAATRQILQLDYSVQPCPHWTYNGRSLREIYNETYDDPE